jgi:carbon-monoxide dehydrogenase iron sulfur subunit
LLVGNRLPFTLLRVDIMKNVYINRDYCIGCRLCELFCQLQHSQAKDLVKLFKKQAAPPLPRARLEENGPVSLSIRCRHCSEAPCTDACLTGALTRNPESGVINVDEEKCIGCGTCILVCPLGAIRLDTDRNIMVKCDLCQGEEVPACVANCPNEALIYADIETEGQHAGEKVIAVAK